MSSGRPSPASAIIDKLPQELKDRILDLCRLKDILSMRLAHRSFTNYGAEKQFASLSTPRQSNLMFLQKRIEALNSARKSTFFRSCVKSLMVNDLANWIFTTQIDQNFILRPKWIVNPYGFLLDFPNLREITFDLHTVLKICRVSQVLPDFGPCRISLHVELDDIVRSGWYFMVEVPFLPSVSELDFGSQFRFVGREPAFQEAWLRSLLLSLTNLQKYIICCSLERFSPLSRLMLRGSKWPSLASFALVSGHSQQPLNILHLFTDDVLSFLEDHKETLREVHIKNVRLYHRDYTVGDSNVSWLDIIRYLGSHLSLRNCTLSGFWTDFSFAGRVWEIDWTGYSDFLWAEPEETLTPLQEAAYDYILKKGIWPFSHFDDRQCNQRKPPQLFHWPGKLGFVKVKYIPMGTNCTGFRPLTQLLIGSWEAFQKLVGRIYSNDSNGGL